MPSETPVSPTLSLARVFVVVHEYEWTNPHTQWTSTPRLCNCMDSIERRRRETSTNYMSPFSGYPWTRGPYVSKPSSPVSRVRSTTGYFNYHPGRDVDPQSLSDPWTGVCKGGGKGPVRWKSLTRREGAILCWEPTNERKKGGIFLRSIRLDGRKVLCLGIIDSRKILYKGLVGTDRVKDLTSGGHRGGRFGRREGNCLSGYRMEERCRLYLHWVFSKLKRFFKRDGDIKQSRRLPWLQHFHTN